MYIFNLCYDCTSCKQMPVYKHEIPTNWHNFLYGDKMTTPNVITPLQRQNAMTLEEWENLKLLMKPEPAPAEILDIDTSDMESDAESP